VDYTPFAGMEITGWPETVLLRGTVVVKDGKLQAEPGSGSYVQRNIKKKNNTK